MTHSYDFWQMGLETFLCHALPLNSRIFHVIPYSLVEVCGTAMCLIPCLIAGVEYFANLYELSVGGEGLLIY